ncbi:hypothetical protein REPUB_Repub20aG0047600 [Reevesia pubescens]
MASSIEPHREAAGEDQENETYSIASQLVFGTVLPMVLKTACELGMFEIIAKAGPGAKLSATDIVAQMPTKNQEAPIMVDRIAKLLASQNVLGCSLVGFERLYSLSSVSYCFVPNQDGVSLGPLLYMVQDKIFLDSWSQLKDAVLEGVAFTRVHGTNSFEYARLDARLNQLFNASMSNSSTIVTKKILESYKGFEGIKQRVDVGGCLGTTLHYITSKYPNIRGINFDLPHVIQNAPSYPGVQHVAGDMFESVPEGDAIHMRWILHSWTDDNCLRLLKNCYKALPDNGKVIAVERILPVFPKTTPSAKANFQADLIMMTQNQGGKERTKEEFMALATGAGFTSVKFVCFVCDNWIMEFYK